MLEGNKCLEKDVGNRTEQSTEGLISNRLVKVALVEENRSDQRLKGQEESHVYAGEEVLASEISHQHGPRCERTT